ALRSRLGPGRKGGRAHYHQARSRHHTGPLQTNAGLNLPRRCPVTACRPTLVLVILALVAPTLQAQQVWGTIKGQVVWEPKQLPIPQPIKPQGPAQQGCPIALQDSAFVVDPTSRGVRWVMVWLIDANDPKAVLPIHPALQQIPAGQINVEMDQPCCL